MSEETEKASQDLAKEENNSEPAPVHHHKPKQKAHNHGKEQPKSREKEDEEISFDFGKITSFFKSKKKKNESHKISKETEKEEVSFDIESIGGFFAKNKIFFLILIPIILAIFFRMQTASLPFTDSWAKSTVDNYYKTQIKSQIDQQYPNLPEQNKLALVEQQFADYAKTNKAQMDAQAKDVSQRFKDYYRDESGNMYMPDIDPYFFLRNAENYLNHDFIGDEKRIINGTEVQWDTHQIAPLGNYVYVKDLHPYFLAYLYKIIKVFDTSTTPMQSAMYFPVLLSALSVIPAFYIGRKLGGNVGGFFSATIVAISSSFLGRTLFGHADTDAYDIFFPLYIIWLFLESLEQKDKIKQIALSAAAGVFMGFFSLAWGGWWYVFDFAIGVIVLYMAYIIIFELKTLNAKKITGNETVRKLALITVSFVVFSGIFVSLLASGGFGTFASALVQPIAFSKLKIAAHSTLWPNVYTTVAELNPASIEQIIASVGGNLLFVISLAGILLLFMTKKESETEVPFAILVVLWYIGIFYASIKGVRFTMMLVPPFAITFGTALGRIYAKGMKFSEKEMGLNKIVTGSVLIVVFCLLLISPLRAAQATAMSDIPIVNDAWYNSLNKIKLQSAQNAIINSWWDFGHHFKYFADRAVTFDGGTQNTPMAHWIGRALLTDDEKLAVGILRMLDCGSNTAFERLNEKINDTSRSVKLLYEEVRLAREDAKKLLKANGLSDSESDDILKYTHCQPPEDYFITSEDMVGKAGVWAHFGSWDFDRADIWVYARGMPHDSAIDFIMKNSNVSRQDAEKLYFEVQGITDEGEANSWIAPWPGYAGQSGCTNVENKTILCENGVKINLTNMDDVEVPTQQGTMKPYSLVYAAGDDIVEKKFDSKFTYSIAFVNREQGPFIVVMQPELAMSIFTRLYYFEGYGLNNFKPFSHESGLTGTNVYVWKVSWEGK